MESQNNKTYPADVQSENVMSLQGADVDGVHIWRMAANY
jgi:hypothetical protein